VYSIVKKGKLVGGGDISLEVAGRWGG